MFKQRNSKEMYGAKLFRESNLRILNVSKGVDAWLQFQNKMCSKDYMKFNQYTMNFAHFFGEKERM